MKNMTCLLMSLLSVFLLTSCKAGITSRAQVGCDQIVDNHLLSLPADNASITTLRDWVKTNYSLTEKDVQTLDFVDGTQAIHWVYKSVKYRTQVRWGSLYIYRDFEKNPPNLKELIACLGTPSRYEARIFPDITEGFDLDISYPNRNLAAYHVEFHGTDTDTLLQDIFRKPLPAKIDDSMLMESMVVGDMKKWEANINGGMHYRPWPSKFADMIIDNYTHK